MKPTVCIGYDPEKPLAQQPFCGKPVTKPDRGRYWCDECNARRLAHIDGQMNKLREGFEKKSAPNAPR